YIKLDSITVKHVTLSLAFSCYLDGYVLFFFFFQAEDGIRDGHVTGVQTCALPISTRAGPVSFTRQPGWGKFAAPTHRPALRMPRSEERRVGKECRSRWAAYQ